MLNKITQYTGMKVRILLSSLVMSLSSPLKKQRRIEKLLKEKKINNLKFGRRIDLLEKDVFVKFVKQILSQPNLP